MVRNAAQYGVADVGSPTILDVASNRVAAARISDQSHARAAGAPFQFLYGLAEFASLVFARRSVRLRLGVVSPRQRIGKVDCDHALARHPVRLHPPCGGDPQRRVVAIAMDEQNGRNLSRDRSGGGRPPGTRPAPTPPPQPQRPRAPPGGLSWY